MLATFCVTRLDSRAVRGADHEVENGAIVPEVVETAEVMRANVGLDPADLRRIAPKLRLGEGERGRRDVGDREVRVTHAEQPRREARRPAANIKDARVVAQACRLDELERALRRGSYQLTFSGVFSE